MGAAKVLIIDEQDQYLVMIRDNHPRFGNDPDLPGGTIEVGESSGTAAVREVYEEAGISISIDDIELLYEGIEYSAHGIEYSLYLTRITPRPEVMLSWEHSSYKWVSLGVFLKAAQQAEDTYMNMAYDVVSKQLN